jgi:Site-specific recombinase XerD
MASYVQRASNSIPEFRQRYEKFSKLLTLEQYSPGTIEAYCSKVSCISLHYNKLPESLSEQEIQDYVLLLQSGMEDACRSRFVSLSVGLRCYYQKMGFQEKKISIPRVRSRKKLPVVLSRQEICRLLRETEDIRLKLMLTLLYSLGLRSGELCRLEIRDVDLDRRRVHIRQSKGRKDRSVQLAEISLPLIRLYLRRYRPEKYLIYSGRPTAPLQREELSVTLRNACIRINCQKHVTTHTLRHSFASHCLEMGMSILCVKEALGHRDLKTTLMYLQIIESPESPSFNPLDKLFSVHK